MRLRGKKMGRGRKPLAKEVHERNGSYVKNPKRRPKKSPTPPKGWPEPTELVKADPKALEKWNDTCEVLQECGVLSKADSNLLELFCINHSMYFALVKKVSTIGMVSEEVDQSGNVVAKRSPWQGELNKIADRQMKLLSEFGLTPSSRTRIQTVKETEEESAFEKWVNRGGLN